MFAARRSIQRRLNAFVPLQPVSLAQATIRDVGNLLTPQKEPRAFLDLFSGFPAPARGLSPRASPPPLPARDPYHDRGYGYGYDRGYAGPYYQDRW